MDIKKIAIELTDHIENFDNKENLSWNDVYQRELGSVKGLNNKNKDLVLIYIVKEISRRGYLIHDYPFKLVRD